jgi:transcriptional regulator with XRE-family HTH domain
VFGRRLADARNVRGWTQQDLSEAMSRLGSPIDRTTIAKLEKGQRKARVDELMALAAAMDVSPVHLLLPLRIDSSVKLAPALTVEADVALTWARGDRPLNLRNEGTYVAMAPTVPWAVWTPGDLSSIQYGGQEGWQARQMAREVERQAEKKERGE